MIAEAREKQDKVDRQEHQALLTELEGKHQQLYRRPEPNKPKRQSDIPEAKEENELHPRPQPNEPKQQSESPQPNAKRKLIGTEDLVRSSAIMPIMPGETVRDVVRDLLHVGYAIGLKREDLTQAVQRQLAPLPPPLVQQEVRKLKQPKLEDRSPPGYIDLCRTGNKINDDEPYLEDGEDENRRTPAEDPGSSMLVKHSWGPNHRSKPLFKRGKEWWRAQLLLYGLDAGKSTAKANYLTRMLRSAVKQGLQGPTQTIIDLEDDLNAKFRVQNAEARDKKYLTLETEESRVEFYPVRFWRERFPSKGKRKKNDIVTLAVQSQSVHRVKIATESLGLSVICPDAAEAGSLSKIVVGTDRGAILQLKWQIEEHQKKQMEEKQKKRMEEAANFERKEREAKTPKLEAQVGPGKRTLKDPNHRSKPLFKRGKEWWRGQFLLYGLDAGKSTAKANDLTRMLRSAVKQGLQGPTQTIIDLEDELNAKFRVQNTEARDKYLTLETEESRVEFYPVRFWRERFPSKGKGKQNDIVTLAVQSQFVHRVKTAAESLGLSVICLDAPEAGGLSKIVVRTDRGAILQLKSQMEEKQKEQMEEGANFERKDRETKTPKLEAQVGPGKMILNDVVGEWNVRSSVISELWPDLGTDFQMSIYFHKLVEARDDSDEERSFSDEGRSFCSDGSHDDGATSAKSDETKLVWANFEMGIVSGVLQAKKHFPHNSSFPRGPIPFGWRGREAQGGSIL
ncbi:hypothetical protein R1sor_016458 [Riccia sorocarpa]|uniref:Uncharacterized protein n=1 Tax=Riccia sorocarpa TaxID=122646 RepID=A0ABD3HI94_9MARC